LTHEPSLAESIVGAVGGRADGRRVRRVTVRIGALTAVVPDAIRLCFDLAVEGTTADGAGPPIEHRPGCGTLPRLRS